MRDKVIPSLSELIANAKEFMTDARAELADPKERIPETLKRLAVGIIVAGFFFGILRYTAAQFRANWQQVIRIDQEELWVRRLVVGLRAAERSEKDRSSLVAALIAGMGGDTGANVGEQGLEIGKLDADLLKEILSAISKKL
jgi:hypothetical protein